MVKLVHSGTHSAARRLKRIVAVEASGERRIMRLAPRSRAPIGLLDRRGLKLALHGVAIFAGEVLGAKKVLPHPAALVGVHRQPAVFHPATPSITQVRIVLAREKKLRCVASEEIRVSLPFRTVDGKRNVAP